MFHASASSPKAKKNYTKAKQKKRNVCGFLTQGFFKGERECSFALNKANLIVPDTAKSCG